VHGLLNSRGLLGGWRVNYKRVHRLWKREHLQVPAKQRKQRRLPGSSESSCVRHRPQHRNHVWSYDFVTDRTEDGRQTRLIAVIDEYTRECLAIEVARCFTARDVILTLQYLFAVRGAPQYIPAVTMDPSLSPRNYRHGCHKRRFAPCTFRKPVPGRMDIWRALTAACEMRC
jgi:hypothetical protein